MYKSGANKLTLVLILFLVFEIGACNLFFESEFDKEQELIDKYHKTVLENDTLSFFYIPKEKIKILFPTLDTIEKCSAKKNQKVLFFDEYGNILYQCKVHSLFDSCNIRIKCLDLLTGDYYITDLSIDSVRGFKGSDFNHFIITSAK